jgi:nucleotide-binding universal stress UspA family protein
MMPFRRILVDIDALAPHNAALLRGTELALHSGAAMTVVDVLPHVPNRARRFVTEAVETELANDRLARVRTAVERLERKPQAESVLLRGEPAHAVAAQALAGGFDLIVRRRGHDQADALPALGSIDRRLVHESPCPVWLLARGPNTSPRRILAAVDLAPDPASTDLAVAVLEAAARVAAVYQADLTVLHAYHLNAEAALMPYVPPQGIHDLRLEAERDVAKALEALMARVDFGPVTPRTALVYAEPEHAIPEYARAHDMDLVVVGTVSRSGLARLVIGSTAERVLHELQRSLLIVKPRAREARLVEVPA